MKITRPRRLIAHLLALVLLQQFIAPLLVDAFASSFFRCGAFAVARHHYRKQRPVLYSSSFTTINGKDAAGVNGDLSSSSQQQQQQPMQQAFDSDNMDASTYTSSKHASSTFRNSRTPYQILYPDSFPAWDTAVTGSDRTLGLASALRVTVEAVGRLAAFGSQDAAVLSALLLEDTTTSKNITASKNSSRNHRRVLRVEHAVAATGVDPLAWLHAQQSVTRDEGVAAVYLANQEDSFEAAGLGTAYHTTHLFPDKDDDNSLFSSSLSWDDLPDQAVWYGGERFDKRKQQTVSRSRMPPPAMTEEWSSFGPAYWMLPTVELRRTRSSPDTRRLGGKEQQQPQQRRPVVTLAVTLVLPDDLAATLSCHDSDDNDQRQLVQAWSQTAANVLPLLKSLSDRCSRLAPPTTLPPVLVRDSNYNLQDGPELYEQAVAQALAAFEESHSNATKPAITLQLQQHKDNESLQKVVLARLQKMHLGNRLTALDVLRRWKYGGHEGGHLFFLRPGQQQPQDASSLAPEFFGCSPERLFQIQDGSHLRSEALAGTRPRGSTQKQDEALLRELFASPKDQQENRLTCQFIEQIFDDLARQGAIVEDWKQYNSNSNQNQTHYRTTTTAAAAMKEGSNGSGGANDTTTSPSDGGGEYFVRRLLHLQHICRQYSAKLKDGPDRCLQVTQQLLSRMHPTPAVCGLPQTKSKDFIRQYEAVGFDRGFYSGPIGYVGRHAADIFVAIRSGLVTQSLEGTGSTVSVYAGSGLVPGSTFQDEWAETNCKFEVISSLFPPSPFTLQSAPNTNVAWAAAFVEELIRNGVTRFYVCPGSRSTPLVVAIARVARTHVGVVQAISVHDERAAGFRAVGYGRGAGRPAAVITSSGTAVVNLYPAIVEAGMDGVPLIVLTADRPYESRDSGANQAIDQVKVFSETYVRWFRDILPPSDDVPVSVALSDAGHAVSVSRKLRGPVHVNIQFRENLAPDAGPIRNDDRDGSVTKYDGSRFTDSAGFYRWSSGGQPWTKSYELQDSLASMESVRDVSSMIERSRRGIIVVGNLRLSTVESERDDQTSLCQLISDFAQDIGFPIFAGVQSGSLRFTSPAVIPFAEHLLKCPIVSENLKPDLILQIGAPLVSTELPSVIASAIKQNHSSKHVLIHPQFGKERADPGFTVSHSIQSEIAPFLKTVSRTLHDRGIAARCHSELAPLIQLGRRLQPEMKSIIQNAAEVASTELSHPVLTEPEIALALSEMLAKQDADVALFLSNSMPVRDAEFFFYPFTQHPLGTTGPKATGTNRGASGIDGIISSAMGFSEAIDAQTTLVIGDLSALHDLNSMHGLGRASIMRNPQGTSPKRNGLTTVIVNNDGGGIFSFLPIAKYGADVAFEEFFGTPTNTFSFAKGAASFGVPFRRATDFASFSKAYEASLREKRDTIVEAVVVGREDNVKVHRRITESVASVVTGLLRSTLTEEWSERLPVKIYTQSPNSENSKTMVLLHGWMGDKSEWDTVGRIVANGLTDDWTVLSVDLPGHGASIRHIASELDSINAALRLDENDGTGYLSVSGMARTVLKSLSDDWAVSKIDAIVGYSLGGRVALEMKRLCETASHSTEKQLVDVDSYLILLSSCPGDLLGDDEATGTDEPRLKRAKADDHIASSINRVSDRVSIVSPASSAESRILFDGFLNLWYKNPIWGSLKGNMKEYSDMVARRAVALSRRGRDLALCISQCSPSRNRDDNWKLCSPGRTLFLAGAEDRKYSSLGRMWSKTTGISYTEISGAGHALLVESPAKIACSILGFVIQESEFRPCELLESVGDEECTITSVEQSSSKLEPQTVPSPRNKARERIEVQRMIESIDFEAFAIDLVDNSRKGGRVLGIGWGEDAEALELSIVSRRSGFIIQIDSDGGREVGLGEVSPLNGLHEEDLDQAKRQLVCLKEWIENKGTSDSLRFSCNEVLALDGELGNCLDMLAAESGIEKFLPSVRSGLEMAVLSLSSQGSSAPIHQALQRRGNVNMTSLSSQTVLPVNGLVTRGTEAETAIRMETGRFQTFPSLKVKVGYQTLVEDTSAILRAFQRMDIYGRSRTGKIRADANRAWNETEAISFASSLDGLDVHALDRIEFVEEPLHKTLDDKGNWSLEQHVVSLERYYRHTAIPYALDESIADLVETHQGHFETIKEDLESVFQTGNRGCAAFVLKPALIGIEISIRIARYARSELGIGAVFSSSFDSGIGLAYTAVLGFLSDQVKSAAPTYPHGVGTFSMLKADTLTPPFASYVSETGLLNMPSLSRALYGLSLDELRNSLETAQTDSPTFDTAPDSYEAATSTSASGKEISVVVSFPLPFSAEIAAARFTDLPQQSRWSPWISSVAYQGAETEWTLNVRGIPLKWRATSHLLRDPWLGIEWQSVSGVKNRGSVEFVPSTPSTCHMNVRMTIVPPRLLRPLFQGTTVFLEDFLREKLVKWSLEMFRDVVKADLALERGELELGDALFEAVEGKASAIEATLENIPPESGDINIW